MKKVFSAAFVGTVFLFSSNLTAASDPTFNKSVFTAIGVTGEASDSPFETDYNTFIPTDAETKTVETNSDNLASIFEVYSTEQTGSTDDKAQLSAGISHLLYTQKLVSMGKMVDDANENISTVEKSFTTDYSVDKTTDAVLQNYLAYKKAITKFLGLQNQAYRASLLGGEVPELEIAKKAIATAKSTFVTSLDSVKDQKSFLTSLEKMDAALAVTKPKVKEADITPQKVCDNKKTTDCEKQAATFLKDVIDKGEQPSYGTVYYKTSKSCVMDKVASSVGSLFNFGELLCDSQVKRHGMITANGTPNSGSLACLSTYNTFGSAKNNILLNPYIARLKNVSAINLALLTKGTGASSSLATESTTPTNVFSKTTATDASKTTTTTSTGTGAVSAISNYGDGIKRLNASQAVSNFYNPSATTYKEMASGAKSFVSSIKPISASISNYSEALTTAMVSSNPKVASLPVKEKNWAVSTLQAHSTTTYEQQLDALRLEFSQQQAQIQSIISQLDVTQKKLGLAQFMALYGSQTASGEALQEVATDTIYLKTLQSQGTYAETRLGLLMASLGLGEYSRYNYGNLTEGVFRTDYMYASNTNENMPKALKLKDLKTPLTLKKGWQNDFKKYIEEMSQKAAEAKREMNDAKAKIKVLLAQKLPTVSLQKLPQPGEIRDELINMQAMKKASMKNLSIINSAMSYHTKRKNAYSAEQYATFKQEQETVDGAMERTISSIKVAEKPVSEAYDVSDSLQQAIPRSEALRAVAQQMVAQGL